MQRRYLWLGKGQLEGEEGGGGVLVMLSRLLKEDSSEPPVLPLGEQCIALGRGVAAGRWYGTEGKTSKQA